MVFSRCLIEEFPTEDKTSYKQYLDMHTTQANSCQVNTGKGFLDIPPELRLMIYSFLPDGRVLRAIYPDTGIVETYGFNPPDHGLVSMSRSCKLIHREISDKLYSSLCVSVHADPHPHHPYEWTTKALWDSLGQLLRHLRYMRHVKMEIDVMLSFGKVNVSHVRALKYLQGPKAFLTALRHAGNTRSLEFKLTAQPDFHFRDPGSGTAADADLQNQAFDRAESLIAQLEQALLERADTDDDEGAESRYLDLTRSYASIDNTLARGTQSGFHRSEEEFTFKVSS